MILSAVRATSRWRAAAAGLLAAVLAGGAGVGQMPSFPGAEGFGGRFAGTMPAAGWFSGGSVYHVTTVDDLVDSSGRPVQGTLRGAFWNYANPSQPKQGVANRVVVFDVGGVFQLTQGSLDIKNVDGIYVAGQTAPTPVTVYGNTTQITKSSNTVTQNVILRYMTFRKGSGDGEDAITFSGGSGTGSIATNMILDHVSASWAEDENLSVANNNTNVTVQYSIISDALTNNHAYASLIRPQVDASVTFHHNLYANNASRQPRLGTYNAATLTMDFVNNVVSNWRDRAGYAGGSSDPEQEYVDLNYVGNMLIAGPGTAGSRSTAFTVDRNVDVVAFQSGNAIDADGTINPDGTPNAVNTGWGMFTVSSSGGDQSLDKLTAPAFPATTVPQSAAAAYHQVIDYVGNSWWSRDPIDTRVIAGVVTNSGPTTIGPTAPNPAELAALLATPTVTRPAGYDTDRDGMPNTWEIQMGLDPYDPADAWYDYDNDKYLNVTEYLNEVGAIPATIPLRFTNANGTSRYEEIGNWQTGVWEPSRFDAAVIDTGTVTVDSIGQYARTLSIAAATAGGTARLELEAGWLDVNQTVTVGRGGSLVPTGGSLLGSPALAITEGGAMTLPAASRTVLPLTAVAIAETAGGGLVDLGAGELSIEAGGITSAALRADVLAGRNGGGWNGSTGIASSAAAAAGGTRAIGYVVAADGSARVSFAAPGDIDLTGRVDVFDLVGVSGSGTYATGLPSAWSQGDFNYDGATTVFDLVAIGSSGVYGQGNYLPAATPASGPSPAVAVVPEPGLGASGCAALAGCTFLGWFCRKNAFSRFATGAGASGVELAFSGVGVVRSLFVVACALHLGVAAADPVTAERISALPETSRSNWQAYLSRSQAAAARDAVALADEVAAANLDTATRAPSGGDFRPDDDRPAEWFADGDGAALVDAVLSYQSPNGGWSKHLGYSQGPRRRGMQWTSQSQPGKKPHYLATIDNGATTNEIRFLAAAWKTTGRADTAAAVNRGVDYLLEAQYPAGGWPQVYPLEGGYHDHVTFNDDAMTNVLELFRDVDSGAPEFACVEPTRRERVRQALERGIGYLLATQVPREGRPTGWCAQYDPLTLEPAQGRAYEPASLAGVESSHVLRFLMSLPDPSAEVVACIEAGLAWLDEAKVTGLARVRQDGRTIYVAQDGSTEVYWARFYDLTTGAPIYPGKDGVVYRSYAELAAANDKLGYDYLSSRPGSILTNGQKKWRKRLATTP